MDSEATEQIAPLVNTCLKAFRNLIATLEDESNYKDNLTDTLGRFRIWAGNVSAHRTGRRSLQFRLRDSSELARSVVRYVGDIISLLEELQSENLHFPGDTADSDDEDDLLFGPASDGHIDHREEVLKEINGVITCLLQLSMALVNPARNDQIRYANVFNTDYFDTVAIEHVRMKLPDAPNFLAERMGKCIGRNYHYFRYREEHHQKLVEGLDGDDEGRESTVATSLKHEIRTQLAFHESDTESVYTATSYAPTMSREPTLRPPERPAEAQDGRPFECPLCHQIITALDEMSWQQHFHEDLPSYVCFQADCQMANRQYSRRREWQQHMKKHMLVWICPFGCSAAMGSEANFAKHVSTHHDSDMENTILMKLAQSCSRSRDDPPGSMRQCPLCPAVKNSKTGWLKHIGHHMEEVALFAVPRHLMTEGDDRDSDEDSAGVGASGQSSLGIEDRELETPHVNEKPRDDSDRVNEDLAKTPSNEIPAVIIDDPSGQYREPADEQLEKIHAARFPGGPGDENSNEGYEFKRHIDHELMKQKEKREELAEDLLKEAARIVKKRDETREKIEAEEEDVQNAIRRRMRDLGLPESTLENTVKNEQKTKTEVDRKSNPLEVREESANRAQEADKEYQDEAAQTAVYDEIQDDKDNSPPLPSRPMYKANDPAAGYYVTYPPALPAHLLQDPDDFRRPLFDIQSGFNPEAPVAEDQFVRDESHYQGQDEEVKAREAAEQRKKLLEEEYLQRQREIENKAKAEEQRIKDAVEQKKREEYDERERLYHEFEEQERNSKEKGKELERADHELRSWEESERIITERNAKQKREAQEAEEQFQEEMRHRLRDLGYKEETIDIMVDKEKAKQKAKQFKLDPARPSHPPVYPKIHRDYLAVETLQYYDLPWEYDRENKDYMIILRDMSKAETDVLFEHTARLRDRSVLDDKKKKPEYAPVRKKSGSESHV